MRLHEPFILPLLCIMSACDEASSPPEERERARDATAAGEAAPDETAVPAVPEAATAQQRESAGGCEQAIERAMAEPSLPGAPAFEGNRSAILAAAKAEPIVFTQRPTHRIDAPSEGVHFREMLASTEFPWDYLSDLLPRIAPRPKLARAILLREGYLFGGSPKLAFALKDLVGTRHLFDEPEIWIQRGGKTYSAKRADQRSYVYQDGPLEGQVVRLLHLDRVGVGDRPPKPLHRALRALRYRLHFDRAEISHLGDRGVVARLKYGDRWVTTLFAADGADLELVCERHGRGAEHLERHREERRKRFEAWQVIRHAIVEQIEERLPFDEPRTEVGQQDGKLRRNWRWAYHAGRDGYGFNGDWYDVFGSQGQPLVPQVCVDFLMDTLERASGTWWRPRGEPRERLVGRLDLTKVLGFHKRRRVSGLRELAAEHPGWLSVHRPSVPEQVEIGHKRRLFDYLADNASDFQPADMVVIKGPMPGDPTGLSHAHSFFVFEVDPLTGMPIVLAGNAGRPALRTWQYEALRTPERKIVLRLRPSTEWLTSIAKDGNMARFMPSLATGDV